MKGNSPIIIALDYAKPVDALKLVDSVAPERCRLKVGKELFTAAGPAFIETLVNKGFDVFLDLKFHDIPNTVARACDTAADLGVWMLNVHVLGGQTMLESARAAIDKRTHKPLLIGVTILTSMSEHDLKMVGIHSTVLETVNRLAVMAEQAGLDGVVCSAMEATTLRAKVGKAFKLVTPGIRLLDGESQDQKRITTPGQAIRYGADYLVIGRPITQAHRPMDVIERIEKEITNAYASD